MIDLPSWGVLNAAYKSSNKLLDLIGHQSPALIIVHQGAQEIASLAKSNLCTLSVVMRLMVAVGKIVPANRNQDFGRKRSMFPRE
jgi:hypothetical protein